jgi:MYXO-CTERM domain-containing protein
MAVTFLGVGLAATHARANGAFPDSQGLLLPADRPNEMILATNFGVVVSQDAGQTWTWSCERAENGGTAQSYQISAAPRDRLFAVTDIALVYSDDSACGWSKAQGMLAGKAPLDYFPDSVNPDRVWAVRRPDAAGGNYTVVESLDGGSTFTTVRFTSAPGDAVTGVEIARTDPNVAYLTIRNDTTFVPKLAVTKNGGATWDTRDLSVTLGNASARIISVDPVNASKLLLRVSLSSGGDGIAVSLDGGMTFVTPSPLTVPGGVLTSFARLPSGTLLLGGADGARDVVFRSTNGGMSFSEFDAPPVRGLGQRAGRVFIVSSNDTSVDGYAIGESSDEGQTWRPLLRYGDIQAIEACVKTVCQASCVMEADLSIWPPEMCTADPAPSPVDGSAPGSVDAAAGDARASSPPATASAGCHCHAAGGDDSSPSRAGVSAVGLVLAAVAIKRRRRRRPRQPR